MECLPTLNKGEVFVEKSEINFTTESNSFTEICEKLDARIEMGKNHIQNKKSESFENQNSENTNTDELNMKKEVFLKIEDLTFKHENIIFIQSSANEILNLREAFEEINKSDIIGLDSEWVKGKPPIRCIIFQIATREKAYVFDFQPKIFHETLKQEIYSHNDFFNELFESLLDQVFKNEKILKVAWDFDLDLKNLNSRFPYNKKLKEMNNFIDLMRVAPKFIEKGLSNHCLFYLGKKLDKTNQVCAWDLRPLTEDKIIYAAMDAIVSIPLYEKMLLWQVKMSPGKLDIHSVNQRMIEWRKNQAAIQNGNNFKFDFKIEQI
jgi:hypothetical protein